MLVLNFSNVEELIFYDTEVQRLLSPELFSVFEQWKLAKRVPYLGAIGKQAILDLLNILTDEDVMVLEQYFGKKVHVEKLFYKLANNITIPLEESKICEELCKIEGFNYYSTFRDDKNLYLTFWR